ncbi:MAG: zinc ribbon domain-containing protein [Acidimicrobiia bacterium]
MPLDHDHRLTADEIHAVVAAWNVVIGPDSPLGGLPAPKRSVPRQELDDRGLLSGSWGRALRVLGIPTGTVRVLQPLPDGTAFRAMYTGTGFSGLVGCWPERDSMRIGFPYTAAGELRDASAALTADFPAQIDPFRAELTVPGLAALAGCVDVLRGKVLGSILAREGHTGATITEADLAAVYKEGMTGSDARWVVTLLNMVMPMSAPMPARVSADGIGELVGQRLIEPNGSGWVASPTLERLTAWLINPLPALAHEVITTRNGAPDQYRYLIAIRGVGPLWTLAFWGGDVPTVTVQSRSGSAYRRVLASTLEPALGPVDAPPDSAADAEADRFCARCGSELEANDAFCSQCGSRVTPPREP